MFVDDGFLSQAFFFNNLFEMITWDSSSYRACYGVLRFIMESGAKGCEVCQKIIIHPFITRLFSPATFLIFEIPILILYIHSGHSEW